MQHRPYVSNTHAVCCYSVIKTKQDGPGVFSLHGNGVRCRWWYRIKTG